MRALCQIASDEVNGYVLFEQSCPCSHVTVTINMHGPPGQVHAIHVHEWGDMSRGCESLGGHYNPMGVTHGSLFVPTRPRHAGDLINNLQFDAKGECVVEYVDDLLTLFGVDTIYGRSVVIHALPDDLGLGKGKARAESLKTGNAGKRIACAIIGKISD